MISTVLFTDIVGSTEKAMALGDRRWREVLRAHRSIVREELASHEGHEIATTGDGFLAVFESPAQALLCAAAIRDAVRGIELSVRCGLHMGEVEREEGDVGGIAVHIGARVAALAGPDEILVSSTVRDAEAGSDFRFEDRGRHELKGVAGEWRIFALSGISEEAAAALRPVGSPTAPGLWQRVRQARLAPVLAIYLAVGVAVFVVALALRASLGLPEWVPAATLFLLVVGLVVVSATAWVQARPQTAARRARGEVPGPKEIDLRGAARAVTRGQLPHLTWGRAIAGGVFAFALVFGFAGLWVVIQDRGQSFAPDEALADAAPGVAVLPFSVQGAGLDVWREGAVDLVGSNLDGAGGLRAIDSRTLLARWHETVKEGERPDLDTSLEVARRAGARYALLGTAVALGRDLRLTADIYDVASGRSLGQAQVQGAPDSVYMLVDRLSIEALKTILGRAEDLPRVELARVTTASLPALKAYLDGEVLYRKADWPAAIEAYRRAVEADSTFALAWLRLGESISWLPARDRPEGGVIEPAEHAARYVERLPEREAVLVRAYRAFYEGSMTMLEPLKATARRYPDDPELTYLLGEHYAHFDDQLLVDRAETARTLDQAIRLDPTFAPYYQHAIEYAFERSDSARALELLGTFEKLVGSTPQARRYRLGAALAWGTPPEQSRALASLDTLRDPSVMPTYLLVHPRFLDARLASAEAALREGDAFQFVFANEAAGRIGVVHEALRAGKGFPGTGFVPLVLFWEREGGLPVDPDTLRALATADTSLGGFYVATALAVEEGRRDEVRAALARERAGRQEMLAAGDTLGAAQSAGIARTIEGFELLQRGEREAALAALIEAQRAATGWDVVEGINAIVRWRIAGLLVELGRAEDAIPWYRSFQNDPYAALELGKIYEDLGRRDEAKEQYETVLAFWRDADPVLQPRVAEARQRLAGLGFRRRG